MPLTVMSIAYPFAPVRKAAVGGAEKILSDLDHALVESGHRSLVVACEGSETAGSLLPVPLPKAEVLTEEDRLWCRKQFQTVINRALASHRVDLVHMHGIDFDQYSIPSKLPTLVSLHMPIAWYPAEIWTKLPHLHFCCVSESQRRTCPPGLRGCTVIPNGVDLPEIDLEAPSDDFAMVMGRICPEKNQHAALDAGRLAGTPVLLAGKVFPYQTHLEYYDLQIRPRLNRDGHQMLGAIDEVYRQQLLSRAKCLLHPTLAPETSSLVAMEALAAGTPVIAYPSGALPEIVEDGITGYLVNSPEEMAQAIGRFSSISRLACRQAAEKRFSKHQMVDRYFELYTHLATNSHVERFHA